MTNLATVRPIFQNGQRLTAERLTQALEFLRTMVRRVLLAPLSSGVAAGFDFTPNGEVVGTELSISPGLAIDGKGRLIVVPIELKFTAGQIAAQAGIIPVDGSIVRICIALDDSSADLDPCSPHRPFDVEEDFKLLFIAESINAAFFQALNQFEDPNCVQPWENLDLPAPGGEGDCCVTLGHVTFQNPPTGFKASTFFRQGVSPRFNVIRNSFGTPSIFLNELQLHSATPGIPDVEEPGVGIPVTTLLGPKPVIVLPGAGLVGAGPITGVDVQATHVAEFLKPYASGTYSRSDSRVFEFGGGSGAFTDAPVNTLSELAAGLGGVAAVPCQLDTINGSVLSAGEPLILAGDTIGGPVRVRRRPSSGPLASDSVIGLSAAPSYLLPSDTTKTVVPVATAGLVKVRVLPLGNEVPAGTDLAMFTQTDLVPVLGPGQRVIARSAQRIPPGLTTAQEVFAWVVHPGFTKGVSTGAVVRTQIPTPLFIGADWEVPSTGTFFIQSSVGATALKLALDDVVDGAILVELRVTLIGGPGHSALPASMPIVSLGKNLADGTTVGVASVTDATGSVALYEQPHDLVATGLTEPIVESSGAWYVLTLTGEDGANAQPDLKVASIRLTLQAT